jgi:hypothetical protein
MWSDTLLAAERAHLLRLALWGASSAFIATTLVVLLTVRRINAPIIWHFAMQALAWGMLELAFSAATGRGLAMRDVSAATRLDRLMWFNAGLDVGIVAVGIALATAGWLGRRLGLVGAGLGISVQGLALLVLNLTFLSILARLV